MLNSEEVKILQKYLDDVKRLNASEDYHDLEGFAMEYGGFEEDTRFIDIIEEIIFQNANRA